jgi:hypothetical protein
VNPAILFGLELPALRAAQGPSRTVSADDGDLSAPGVHPAPAEPGALGTRPNRASIWFRAAVAAQDAGFGAVWVPSTEHAGRNRACDALALAGALSAITSKIMLGVVAGYDGSDRNPSVLARDVTTLDVLSDGRAAVLFDSGDGRGGPKSVTDLMGPEHRLAEAITVCRMLFIPGTTSYTGRHFHLAGAVNRPLPVCSGGPPLLAMLPVPRALPRGERSERPWSTASPEGAGTPDAWVVGGGPGEVAGARERLEVRGEPGVTGPVRVVWRGALPRQGTPARFLAALRTAGADGLILRPEEGPVPLPEAVMSLGAAVRPLLERWGPR